MTVTINNADIHLDRLQDSGRFMTRKWADKWTDRRKRTEKACRDHAKHTLSHDGVPRIADKSLHTVNSPAVSAAEYDLRLCQH